MRFRNVHSRELPAPAERVGELIDAIGGPRDELWPIERWPKLPMKVDQPLGVGARGRHGFIRYQVDEYEPGRRVGFRFTPGSGVDGTHSFEVEALDAQRSRLTHTLDARVGLKLLPVYTKLVRAHNALLEDLLDNAERAVGGDPGPSAERAVGGDPARPAERGRRPLRWLVPGTLTAIAAIHAAWALGWRWPGGSDQALADRVVGDGAQLPSAELTWLVAAALLTGAAVVRAAADGAGGRVRTAAWAVSAILLVRGAVYIPIDLANGLDDTYSQLDLAIYSPLCLALGAGTARLLRRARPAVRRASGGAWRPAGRPRPLSR